MESTDDTQLITLSTNLSVPLSQPPPATATATATVVPPLEIISPKPKRLMPNLAAYLEHVSDDDDETEEDEIEIPPRTTLPELIPGTKASISVQ